MAMVPAAPKSEEDLMQTATARRPLYSGASPCLALGWTVLLVLGLGCVSCSTGAKPDVAADAQVPDGDALPHGLPGEIAERPILMVKATEKPTIVARLGEQPYRQPQVWRGSGHFPAELPHR